MYPLMGREEFISFYKPLLNFTDDEWTRFINTMESRLPSALRITNTKFKNKIEIFFLKEKLISKNKFFRDVYDTVHKGTSHKDFIINQTSVGHIQKQEIVSMLPVLLMGLKENHSVLDMCAAPGSKTKQLLEKASLVVANDCSSKRLNILISETCKIPHASYLVVKHDASALPVFKTDFDRVLCDVPCSGDGTARKNPQILNNWNIGSAANLSNLQYRILKHAINFVKSDGLIIYSTCSLNPIENEQVVLKAIMQDDLEIVDLRKFIDHNISKDFVMRDGIIIKDENGLRTNFEDLKKCIRIYPHDNDTGGFFIVGLKKKSVQEKDFRPKICKNNFCEITDECRSKLEKEYSLEKKTLICRGKNMNTIYETTPEILSTINNSKLNIMHVGYKIFEQCNLNLSGYRMKNVFNKNFDIEISGIEPIRAKMVYKEFRKGSVVVRLLDFDVLIGGFSYGNKISLYISNNLQKALLDFFN